MDVSMKDEELCEAFSNVLLKVDDIDEGDSEMPQLCSEYVKDIYVYLRNIEAQQTIRPRCMQGYEINERMRALLVDWLVQVHARFQLLQETLYMTVAILDRFLQVQPMSRRKLQLVGVTAMLLASKYEDVYATSFSPTADVEKHTLAKYLTELTLTDYDMLHFRPSELTAATLCLSQMMADGQPWAVRTKYASSKPMKISLHPQLQSSAIQDMAAPLLPLP